MSGSAVFFDGNWREQTFTSSGTFNVPSGVRLVFIELWGGGGAGSDAAGAGPGPDYPGESAVAFIGQVIVTPSSSVTVTIGAGGTITVGPGNGGGDSIFGVVRSPGGLGGADAADVIGGGEGGARSGLRGTGGAPGGGFIGGDGGHGNGGAANTGSTAGLGAGGGAGTTALAAPGPGAGGNGICIVSWKII